MSGSGQFTEKWLPIIGQAFIETVQMVSISLFFAVIIGIPLGILLVLTRPGQLFDNKWIYQILNLVINIIRSIPFIILLFFILPFTKFIVGTTIGVKGVIVPLVIYTAPYIARLMESALLEVESGIIEAYIAMGIKRRHIIWHVLLREARPSIILGLTIATVSLIGATAMAGLVGAGGLGDLAYRYGYLRYEVGVMYATVIILIILVQVIQSIGNRLATRMKKD
ncbi:D-methionine transport system permease protein [Thermolongibacillus altinsuensis]|uniref:D-methionine transport system permease protein n=1 Tax=Thermolongibacillus altinsuensis TaxID=575256 RepID=A0A4R1QJJ8_9BACL|nr:methionine ABC transporter permease [Thermolongibacillus altinsuensis]TCL53287.1 D-methionine transport system permease protein [Thermolongibacillus altinsuensis]